MAEEIELYEPEEEKPRKKYSYRAPPRRPPEKFTPTPSPPSDFTEYIFKILIFFGLLFIGIILMVKPIATSSTECPTVNCPSFPDINFSSLACPDLSLNVTCGNNTVECPKSLYYIEYSPTNDTCLWINKTMMNITNITYNYIDNDLNITMLKWYSNGTLALWENMTFMGSGEYNLTVENETYKIVLGGS